jgi:hypothetical protein
LPRSDYIRQEFRRGRSRSEIARELGVPYQVVYQATYGWRPVLPEGSGERDAPGLVETERPSDLPASVSVPLNPVMSADLRDRALLEGRSGPEVASRAIEEYLRATRFPGIVFVTAAGGLRTPRVLNGLAVWEYWLVARRMEDDVERIADYLQQPAGSVRLALAYHSAYPEEVDAHLRVLDETAADPARSLPQASVVKA